MYGIITTAGEYETPRWQDQDSEAKVSYGELACRMGDAATVKGLIAKGWDAFATEHEDGMDCLEHAILAHQPSVVKALLANLRSHEQGYQVFLRSIHALTNFSYNALHHLSPSDNITKLLTRKNKYGNMMISIAAYVNIGDPKAG